MRLTEIVYEDAIPVDGYGPGFFRLAGEVLEGAILVFPDRAELWDGPDASEALVARAAEFDVVLFGTGPEMGPVPGAFRRAIEEAGMGVEPMASPVACRTYNMLAAEGRRVVLAALPA